MKSNGDNAHLKIRIVFLLGILLLVLAYLRWPLWSDHSLYLIMGRLWSKGYLPYRDVFEQNWPGTIWVSQAVNILFGPTSLGLRAFDLIWQSIAVFILYQIAQDYFNKRLSIACILLYIFLYLTGSYGSTATRDSFATLPLGAALLITINSRQTLPMVKGVVIGLLIAISVLFKPTLGMVLACLVMFILYQYLLNYNSVLLKLLLAILIGFILTISAWLIYFYYLGILPYFFRAMLFSFKYANYWSTKHALVFLIFYPPGRLILIILALIILFKINPIFEWKDSLISVFYVGTLFSLLFQRRLEYVHTVPMCYFGSLFLFYLLNKEKDYFLQLAKRINYRYGDDLLLISIAFITILPIGYDLPISIKSVITGQSWENYADYQRIRRSMPPWSLVEEIGEIIKTHTPVEAHLLCLVHFESNSFYLTADRPPAQPYVSMGHFDFEPNFISNATEKAIKNGVDIIIIDEDAKNLELFRSIINRKKYIILTQKKYFFFKNDQIKTNIITVYISQSKPLYQ